jgi:hypothetical protein
MLERGYIYSKRAKEIRDIHSKGVKDMRYFHSKMVAACCSAAHSHHCL